MTSLPEPPAGWPTLPEHRTACGCEHGHRSPGQPAVVYMQPPARSGPSAGALFLGVLGGGGLLLTAAISAVAVALAAVAIAVCAVTVRWIIRDMRRGR